MQILAQLDLLSAAYFLSEQNKTRERTGVLLIIHVSAGPDVVVNASHNWWGSNDVMSAYSRVYDQRINSFLILIDIDPILTVDCFAVLNCSDRGVCVGPNICRCDAGKPTSITVVEASVKFYCS